MKKKFTILVLLIICLNLTAQDTVYVHKKNGSIIKTLLKNTDSLKIISVEKELNKQYFRKWNGDPTIPYQEYATSLGIDKLWNNKWGSVAGALECYTTKNGGGISSSVTFDLNYVANTATGVGWKIPTRMKIFARSGYNYLTLGKYIRVWGSTSPTVSTANTTGPDAWMLLSPEEGFLITPPSGQSGLTPTAEDKKYIEEDGYELFFNANAPPIRYFRLETVSKWDGSTPTSFNIGEITIWGKEYMKSDTLCIMQKANDTIKIPINDIDSIKFEGSLSTDLVYPFDKNGYRNIKIGTQNRMVDNLRTTQHRNGKAIDNVTENVCLIPPPQIIENWRRDYEKMQNTMIYDKLLTFNELMARITQLGERIKNIKS